MLNRSLELTRRIDDEDAAAIELELSKLENVDASIAQLVNTLDEGRWQDNCITDPNMPFIALMAYQNNQLSLEKISTLLMYWSARQLHGDNIKPITPADPRFKQLIANTLRPIIPADIQQKTNPSIADKAAYSSQLSAEQINDFFNAIDKLPLSEQVIFAYDETINLIELLNPDNIQDRLTQLNFTCLTRDQSVYSQLMALKKMIVSLDPSTLNSMRPVYKQTTSIVPSFGLMKSYLTTKIGEKAVRINPVIGSSSTEDIHDNGLKAERDLQLHLSWVKKTDIADDKLIAKWIHFTLHDFFHAFAASAIPDEHRKLFVKISDQIKNYLAKANLAPSETEAINKFADALYDMEHFPYRTIHTLLKSRSAATTVEECFLLTLITGLRDIIKLHSNSLIPKAITDKLLAIIMNCIGNNPSISAKLPNLGNILRDSFPIDEKMSPQDKLNIKKLLRVAEILKSNWRDICTHSPTLFSTQTDDLSNSLSNEKNKLMK